ncbi:MAG TPA: hypothetical protein VKI61_05365, partial [Chitinophagaceae bacterium]|nr:hypothetical protein [Chitinophagaceae bacterium]
MEKRNTPHFDISDPNLSKEDLETLKLRKEIEKLQTDINDNSKSWFQKNLGILIPSMIGLGTLFTGYYTGYFSRQKLDLENQRYDLKKDVNLFTIRKDSLNKVNLILDSSNAALLATQDSLSRKTELLISDTLQLHRIIKTNQVKINHYQGEQKQLTNDITKLNQQKAILGNQNASLSYKLKTSSFDVLLSKMFGEFDKFDNGSFLHLENAIREQSDRTLYYKRVKETIDSSKNNLNSYALTVMMYRITSDNTWLIAIHKIADLLSDTILDNHFCETFYSFLQVFDYIGWANKDQRINMVRLFTQLSNKIISKKIEVSRILQTINNMARYNTGNSAVELSEESPKEFCELVWCGKECLLHPQGSYSLINGAIYFLKDQAPITLACILVEIFPLYIKDLENPGLPVKEMKYTITKIL